MTKKKNEVTPARSPEEINNEYARVCAALGDAYVKLKSTELGIAQLMAAVESLNKEMIAANAAMSMMAEGK